MKSTLKQFLKPLVQFRFNNITKYIRFFKQRSAFKKMPGGQSMPFGRTYPVLGEDTALTGIDHHYFYQGIWATKLITQDRPALHVDVASRAEYVGTLTALTKVQFVDLRPLDAVVENLENIKGDILHLPFRDGSVRSLSCLHVAEHIGLGRYGDPLDPEGTTKACAELARILAPGGNLYFSLPIGKECIEFNAHRIHDPHTIIEYFKDLKLVSFSHIDDQGKLHNDGNLDAAAKYHYGCGLFHFTKA